MNDQTAARASLRLPISLLLLGQLSYVGVTLLHAGGDANNHHAIFSTYAENAIWTAVHLGQFLSMAIMIAGLFALNLAVAGSRPGANWMARIGAGAAVAALALYAALQAVDGVALKQAVNAWASAPEAEKAARFAAAEAVRWLEWGMRSYHDFALGLALLLSAAGVAMTARFSAILALLIGLSGIAYLAQGWIAGTEGFAPAQSLAIVAGWVLGLLWMVWLAVSASRESAPAAAPNLAAA
ncbi:MAG TPA: hypothetical protein VHB23_07210 [Devosiaceae bacterium]|jgi:hypothetical protein|nr:hypothetical protein [Devosiaceae bacterium]